jgi:hypothetical protein
MGGCAASRFRFNSTMPTLEQVENDVAQLSKSDQRSLLDWLEDVVEDEREFTDAFKTKIAQAKQDIAAGRGRVVEP